MKEDEEGGTERREERGEVREGGEGVIEEREGRGETEGEESGIERREGIWK